MFSRPWGHEQESTQDPSPLSTPLSPSPPPLAGINGVTEDSNPPHALSSALGWDKQSDGPHRTPHCTRIESRAPHTHTSHPHHLIGIAGASRGPVPALPLSPFEPKGIWCLQPSLHIKESRPTASRRHSSERGRTSSCGRRLTRGGSQLKSNESARGGSQSGLASRRGGASATGAVKSRVSLPQRALPHRPRRLFVVAISRNHKYAGILELFVR